MRSSGAGASDRETAARDRRGGRGGSEGSVWVRGTAILEPVYQWLLGGRDEEPGRGAQRESPRARGSSVPMSVAPPPAVIATERRTSGRSVAGSATTAVPSGGTDTTTAPL